MATSTEYAFASGGIFWKIFDRTKFENKDLRHQILILFTLVMICWLPLAALSFVLLGWTNFYLLFIRDIATQVRFLIVMPILLVSRRSLNKSFNQMVSFFYETKIIDAGNKMPFERILEWLKKWSNSLLVDVILLILVYSSFYFQVKNQINHVDTYAPWHQVDNALTPAGWWYLLVSLPVLQMLLYRWLYTILLWMIFLRKISKINLNLSALHPD